MAKRSRKAAERRTEPTRKEMVRSRRDQERWRRMMIGFGSLLGLIVVVLLIGAVQQFWLKPRAPVATVNGANISTSAYQDRVRYEKFRVEQRFGPLISSGPMAQQIAQYIQTQLPTQVFETMITDEILRQEAQKQNVTISEQQVDEAVQAEFDYYPGGTPTPTSGPPTTTPRPTATLPPGTPAPTVGPTSTPFVISETQFKEDYQKFLSDMRSATGLGEPFFRDAKRAQLLYEHFRKQAIAQANIPATSLQVHARHIVTETEEEAKKVVERLKAGGNFAAVAKEVSKDTSTAESGGDLGWFSQGQKDPVIERAAFVQPVGQIGDPVKSSQGWHVIEVLDPPQQRALSVEERRQKEEAAFDTWLNNLQTNATIERNWRPDVVPNLAAAPAAAATAAR